MIGYLFGAKELTKLSALIVAPSIAVPTFLATARINSGSNLAESSSFITARAMAIPSLAPGGEREPPAKACETASFKRVVERDR